MSRKYIHTQNTGQTSQTRNAVARCGKGGKKKMKNFSPAELCRMAVIILWWMCVGVILSVIRSAVLNAVAAWIMAV